MRSQIDEMVESMSFDERGVPIMEKPPEGKAFERLKYYLEARGLDGPAPAQKGKKKKGEASETLDEGPSDVVVAYAQACLDAYAMAHEGASYLAKGEQADTEAPTEAPLDMSPPTAAGPNWRFLGPYGMANGQTYGDTRIQVAGRISCIAVDPSNPNHVLCGAAAGGVWESFNRGNNWAPRTDYMPTMAVGAIAFNPITPSIVYCGTGEGNFYRTLGAGVMRSTNGGTTWAMIATAPFVGQGFYDLIVDRANPNNLIAATTGGIYTSTNGGFTWTLRRAGICWSLASHPLGGTNELLAACSTGLFRSVNAGVTWTAVPVAGSPASYDRLAVAISRTNPAVAYMLGASGTTVALFRRNGGVWSPVAPPPGLSTAQAWYDWFLAVSPDNPSQIYLGGIEAYRGTLGISWTWVTISNKPGQDIHPDQHAIAFDPTNANNIYIGNDGGMYYSQDRGISWVSLNNTLGITEIEFMGQDYGSSHRLIAGTQDNGSIRYSGNPHWEHAQDGDGGDCGINRANPNIVYHTFFGMGMERSTAGGGWGTYSWIGPSVPAGYSRLFYPPVEVCNDTVAQAGQTVYISRNQGTTWTNVALPAGMVGSAMYIPNPNLVFVGTNTGRIFRIGWSGAAWLAPVELTSPRLGAFVSDLHVSPSNTNRIWATYTTAGGGRVFFSANGGATWTNFSAGLPNLPINAVEVDPGNPNRLWVAADVGVYRSLNGGSTWTAFSDGLPNTLAVDLIYHPHARVLRVATRNRGVWEVPVDGWLTAPVCGVQWNGSLAPNQTQKWFTFNWPATWHMLWTVMPTSIAPGAPQITWDVHVERANAEYVTYWITVSNKTAATVTFEGRFAILSYY